MLQVAGAEEGQDVPVGLSIPAKVGWCRAGSWDSVGEGVPPPSGSSAQGAAGQAEACVQG